MDDKRNGSPNGQQGDCTIPAAPATQPEQAPPPPPVPPEPASRGAWWLIVGVALPEALLAAVLWRILEQPALAAESSLTAVWLPPVILAAGAVLCALWSLLNQKRLPGSFWAIVSGVHCIWLTFAGWKVLPDSSVFDSDLLLIACSLAMAVVITSMLRVVLWLTPPGKAHSVGTPFLSLLGVPVLVYLSVAVADLFSHQAATSILLLMAVVTTYGFVFLLVRTLYLVLLTRHNRPMQIIIAFVLPILGLLISQTIFESMFWDFSSPVYYLLVLANGALLLVPEPRGALRLLLHFGRGAGTLFVLYFFVCLSPYYALSLLGMIAYGAGILVLAPLFLLLYQGRAVAVAFRGLAGEFGRLTPAVVFLLGMLLIPAGMALHFSGDRENVETAMAYVGGSAGADVGRVDIPAIRRSLRYMGGASDEGRTSPPLLTGLYNRSVSGSRTLGGDAYRRTAALFLDEGPTVTELRDKTIKREGTPAVVARDIVVETVRDGDDYRSTLHFTIENTGTGNTAEYATSFHLPEGVYISGYYLDVFGQRKQGLMTVREAAIWIYERTVSKARDPGILFYDGDTVAFRVFPFAAGEVRQTGIEFLHRETVELTISGRTFVLAPDAEPLTEPVVEGGVAYFSAAAKQDLAPAARSARYVFVVDCSKNANRSALITRMREFCQDNDIAPEDAAVMALNYRSATWPMQGDWETPLQRFPAEGGFGLDGAIGGIYDAFSDDGTYPVVVAVTNGFNKTLLPDNLGYAAALCPELDGYLRLGLDGLTKYPFDGGGSVHIGQLEGAQAVLGAEIGGERLYLYNNGKPQVMTVGGPGAEKEESPSDWAAALQLEGDYRLLQTTGSGESLPLIRESMRTGIMTPLTSYIVLETAEQEAALLARQQKILAGESGIQAAGEPVSMSEPPLLVCLLLIPAAVTVGRRRKRVKR